MNQVVPELYSILLSRAMVYVGCTFVNAIEKGNSNSDDNNNNNNRNTPLSPLQQLYLYVNALSNREPSRYFYFVVGVGVSSNKM